MDNNKEEMEKVTMEEGSTEKVETNNQDVAEEIVVDTVEEKKEDGKVMKFIKNILSGVVDQIAAVIIGLILYLIVSLVFKVAGYKIVMKEEMFLVVFIISNVLYYPLVQEFLGGKTLGRKLVQR